MANNGTTTQALIGAFTFGSVVYAASAALVLYINGHGAAVFRDSQRLVLVLFLISSALWAAIDFATTLIDTTGSSMPCQIGVIFASIFDQLARFSIEQFLLWALNSNKGGKLSVVQLLPQILVLARFLAGAVFVGFTRPQTDDYCLATTSALPVGVAVLALDAIIIVLLIQKAYSSGGAAKTNSRSLTSVLLGLICWTAASIVMLLGITTIPSAARTALPAGGLLVLIVFITAGAMTLISSRKSDSGLPEAPSPRRINISRDISTADSEYPPSRFEDLKEANIRSSRSFVNPREVPNTKDETSAGFPFAMSVATQGVPAMPPPVSSEYVRQLERSASQKKGMWGDFGKRTSSTGGRPVIGKPVLQSNEDGNPLNKITVIDLQSAIMADKERRQTRIEEEGSLSVPHRSVMQSMHLTPEEGVKRAASMKRKDVASVSSRQSAFPGGLQADSSASTTSAQLSPASDETRRRSPRQPEPEEQRPWTPEKLTPAPQPARASQNDVRPVTVLLQANVPQPIQRPGIRPSRQLPPSPDTPPQEAAKTPLQRRPTIGLPTNPRARGIQVGKEMGASSQHKTIMFINNIEYHDPVAVGNIMSRANTLPSKPAPTSKAPARVASVVNRPRPIPRKPDNIASPSHRRSKSASSLLGRKSILDATSGSPTQLPPLPPAPRSVGLPLRPQPNNTKSMTFDEKMTLLFPAPPRSKSVRRRSSSVPELPKIPMSYLDATSSTSEADNQTVSNRITKSSVRTDSILEVDEIPRKESNVQATDETSKAWISAFEAGKQEDKRKSSPVIPALRASAWTETTVDDLGTATNWSSMNSPEYAMPMAIMPAQGLPAAVRMPAKQVAEEPKEETRVVESRNSDDVPFMLDTSTFSKFGMRKSWLVDDEVTIPAPEEPEPEPVPEPVSAPKSAPQSQWHRRVGDECPAFSKDCLSKKGCRKTPPTPLSLRTPNKKAVIVHAEPSPLESPEHALQQIQAQLKKLEEPEVNADTPSQRLALLEMMEKEMGMQVDHWKEMKHDIGRDSLSSVQTSSPAVKRDSVASVANIVPETANTRVSIGSDRRASRIARLSKHSSMSKIEEQPSARNSGSAQMSKWQKRLTEAQMEYMDARLLRESSVNFLQLTRAQLASPTPPESDTSSINLPEEEEVPPVPELPAKCLEQTPEPSPEQPKAEWLWTPPSRSSAPAGLLWTAPIKVAETEVVLPSLSVRPMARKEPEPLQIHSTHLWRKPYTNTSRSTTGLWKPVWASAAPPAEPVKRVSQVAAPQPQKAPRPVTQRPPRRNKRVTLLPDIIENPEPLPNKRGTLGIFQFPWGEKSDTASVQARPPVLMAMPGTMASGAPVRSQQTELSEYSSSFFDDYDDDDDVVDGMNSDEDGSDDGFDETTLWEIASLLKVDNVPSRSSLVPSEDSVLGDYVEELESDDEDQSSREQSIVIGLAEPSELVVSRKRDSATLESDALTILNDAVYEPEPQVQKKPVSKPVARIGLPSNPRPAPPAPVAESQVPAAPASAPKQPQFPRHPIKSTQAETAVKQVSAGLWSPPVTLDKDSSRGGLFAVDSNRTVYRTTTEEPAAQYMSRSPRPAERKPLDSLVSTSLWTAQTEARKTERHWIQNKAVSAGLWTPPVTDRSSSRGGLFVVDPSRTVFRTTTEEPAAQYMSRSPRPADHKPLDKLASTSLWTVEAVVKTERNWIQSKPVSVVTGVWSPPVVCRSSSPQGLFTVDPSRTVYRTTTEEPAARSMSRSPCPVERKPLEQLKSTSLWTLEAVTKTERNWIQGQAKPKKTTRPEFSLADWRAALNKAVAASYPKVTRIAATAAEWDAALEEALALSYPAKFDSSVRHPVFAAKSLITRSEWFHPAATGYTYDVANVHPVFFGSLAITCPLESVHPAISSYAAKKLRRQASKAKRERSASSSTRSRRDTIQAQIEALEQERLFAQQFAQAEYRRRNTSISAPFPPPPPIPTEEPTMATTTFETVQDIQRRLSHRIRESLVISRQTTPEQTPVSTPARTHSRSKPSVSRSHKSSRSKVPAVVPTKPAATLWAPPAAVAVIPSQQMWGLAKGVNTPTADGAVEDAESAARRQKGRKTIQKKARKVEILGQIRAVKRGEDPFERFEGQGLWAAVPVVEKKSEVDWLHKFCVAKPVVEMKVGRERRRTSVSLVPIPERREVVSEEESWRAGHGRRESKGSRVVLRY
ncbi:Putative protein of unknown function [Podospora comata]|uniref:Uncharacterized protein n=1 Tax=Podospora comata TaxID=48703 RepID=A0ABY6S9Q6_PODCO|nr:Putative protein of unknown function [Podospora comata]